MFEVYTRGRHIYDVIRIKKTFFGRTLSSKNSFVVQIDLKRLHWRVKNKCFKCVDLINETLCLTRGPDTKFCLTEICVLIFNFSVQPNLSHKRLLLDNCGNYSKLNELLTLKMRQTRFCKSLTNINALCCSLIYQKIITRSMLS